ncbi:hypothetical protein ACHAXT_002341 [Thalassiosira profunda]
MLRISNEGLQGDEGWRPRQRRGIFRAYKLIDARPSSCRTVQYRARTHMHQPRTNTNTMTDHHDILHFKFAKFADLPCDLGDTSESEVLTDCRGNSWKFILYPGGRYGPTYDEDEEDERPFTHLRLEHVHGNISFEDDDDDEDEDKVVTTCILRDAEGAKYHEDMTTAFTEANHIRGDYTHDTDFLRRDDLLEEGKNYLLDGALIIDLHLQYQINERTLYRPVNPLARNMLKSLDTEEDTDVSFKIGDTIICAHKLILKMNAPTLYNFCRDGSKESPIPIENMEAKIFRCLLRYVYGASYYHQRYDQRKIIDAANRFDIVGLKLAAENWLVVHLNVEEDSDENVIHVVDWILFADSMTCALLKEHLISFFVARAADVMRSEHWKKLRESPKLMEELLAELSKRTGKKDSRFDRTPKNMTVSELRKGVCGKGLEAVDGSKEMLVSQFRELKRRRRT